MNINKFTLAIRITLLLFFITFFSLFKAKIIKQDTLDKTLVLIAITIIIQLVIMFLPKNSNKKSAGKMYNKNYIKPSTTIKEKTNQRKRQNKLGRTILFTLEIIYFLGIAVLLYFNIFNDNVIYLIVLVVHMLDSICISIYCPFRILFTKNKCCNDCPMYNWGPILVFSPLILIPNPFTITIFVLSLLHFIQWEYFYKKHNYRFNEYENINLKCANCKHIGKFNNCLLKNKQTNI